MADIPTLDDLKRLLDQQKNEIIAELEKRLSGKRDENFPEWLRTFQVKKLLQVSDATLSNYRAENLLPSTKIRGSHFYKKSDVLKLMNNGN